MAERTYTVEQLFEILEGYKITSNIESVRRWLREGTIEGIAPTSRKVGWKVTQTALDAFLKERLPERIEQEDNTTNVVIDREEIRAQMWREITSKNIWEGHVSIKRSMLKAAAEHRYYTPELIEKVWDRITTDSSNRGYKQPRVNYLLDAFSFQGERVLLDKNFASIDEQVVYALIEHVKEQLHRERRKTITLHTVE